MLTFVIDGDSHLVTAEQFRSLVDVAVRIMKDASKDAGLEFTVEDLHASTPTIVWEPRTTDADGDVDEAFARVAQRIEGGIEMLEHDDGLPEWMTAVTANALYQAADWFGETSIDGVAFLIDGKRRKLTRQTYRTLDRVLHEDTDALGSITGILITATLREGPHVTVRDEVHERGVECYVDKAALREASQLIGERVTVVGRIRRDYLGRPDKIADAKVDAAPKAQHVSVLEMAGVFRGGPDSVKWLREQRGG